MTHRRATLHLPDHTACSRHLVCGQPHSSSRRHAARQADSPTAPPPAAYPVAAMPAAPHASSASRSRRQAAWQEGW